MLASYFYHQSQRGRDLFSVFNRLDVHNRGVLTPSQFKRAFR